MEIVKSRKEKAVILFFWIMLAVVIVMTTINLTVKKVQKESEVTEGAGQPSDVEGRIVELKKLLRDNPRDTSAMIILGDLYIKNKQIREAIEVFEEADTFEPNNIHIQSELGGLYVQSGAFNLAQERFQKVLNIDPDDLNSLFNMGMIYRHIKKENKKALEIFEELLAKNPQPEMAKQVNDEIAKIKAELR